MDEALKKITSELEAEFRAWLDTAEIKSAIESTKAAKDSGTFEVVITTENLDRYQEVIKLDGWELEHYRANPVVLWGHNHYELPIGVATDIRIENGKMIAKGKFAPHPFAQTIRQLYDAGVMRATSVGFIEKEREGNLITKAELLEFSFVSIPANPYALSTLVKSGISINEMVTKGILNPGKEADITDEPVVATTDDVTITETTTEEPATDEKTVTLEDIAQQLKALSDQVVALEAKVETPAPECNDDPQEEMEEEKQFREFSEKRKLLQDASTVLAEVLAEARQAIARR